jgi:hypothetical protein
VASSRDAKIPTAVRMTLESKKLKKQTVKT